MTEMQLGRYQILREIARSNDIVYEARDPQMNRRVAVKELAFADGLTGAARRERIERFYREARAAGQLTHPNIVTIHEVGEDAGRYFIAMEFLEGQTLRQRMSASGALPLSEAVKITVALCDALEYAHQRGIVHRDIKPDNIHLLPGGIVKLTDFGIARILHEQQLTVAGQVFGTPSYMSPEQIRGAPIDARADIFSLGILLWEMLAGRKPFPGDSVVTITYKIMNEPLPPLTGVPPAIEAALFRATAKDPAQRFSQIGQFRAALTSPGAYPSPPSSWEEGRRLAAGEMPAPYAPPQGTVAYSSATQLGVAPGHAAPPQQTYAAPVPPQDPIAAQKRRTMLSALFGGAVVLAAVFAVGAAFKRAYQNSQVYSGVARVTEDMNAAANLYNSGQYEKAAAEFQRLRRSGNMTALTYEAFCYRQLGHQAQKAGDFQKAQQYYNQALAINPDDSQARVEADAAGKVVVGLATPGPSTATPEPIRTTEWPKAPAPGTPNFSATDFQNANARSEQAAQAELGAGDAAWQRGDKEEAYRHWRAAISQGVGTQASVTASQRLAQYGGQ